MKRSEQDSVRKASSVGKRNNSRSNWSMKRNSFAITSETQSWPYVPAIGTRPSVGKASKDFLRARTELVDNLAYAHLRVLNENFRDLINNASNDVLHIIYYAIHYVVSRDLELIVDLDDPGKLKWAVTINLVTQPSASGYEFRCISFQSADGLFELFRLDDPPPQNSPQGSGRKPSRLAKRDKPSRRSRI